MKMTWLMILGTTAALAALMVSPALGQTHSQRVTVTNSGSGQHSQITTIHSTSTSRGGATGTTASRQEVQLSLRAAHLHQPHRLQIEAVGASLGGEIKLNGRTIHRLQGASSGLDLSPHLSVGDHVVEITGRYTPAQGTVQISLIGPGTTLMHQVSGQGQWAHRLRLSVR
jgi:hypothetical protein